MSPQHRQLAIEMATTNPDHESCQPGNTDADRDDALDEFSELVTRAQRGDSEAFRALYRDTQPRILRYLRALVADDAEDIASETWLNVARDLHAFHGDDELKTNLAQLCKSKGVELWTA